MNHSLTILQELMEKVKKESRQHPCLFNFILYAKKEHIDSYLTSVVKRISNEYPCNILLLQEGDREEIMVDLPIFSIYFSNKEELPLLLFPLLKSDLPTYLLFAEDPAEFSLPGMENYITKVIFDSSRAPDLSSFAKRMIDFPYPFADLAWNRIEQWQQLFAEQFNRKDKLNLMSRASSVSIFYKGICPIQALYLQAWMAFKLGWKIASFEKDVIRYLHQGEEIIVQLIADETSVLSHGRITAVHIESKTDGQMRFIRDPQKPHVATIEQMFLNYCEMPSIYFFDEERFGRSLSMEVCKNFTNKSLYHTLTEIANYPQEALCR
ncbi:MAG: hypothetical protein FJZ56_04545 [Chlamydiae bacterium]|nr:hypothetical protein [Chlamydiota bacterium]